MAGIELPELRLNSNKTDEDELVLSANAQRRMVGFLGLGLGGGVSVVAHFAPTDGIEPHQITSISAHYYTAAGDLFVGVMFALFVFLFTYRGYSKTTLDRILGVVGGLSALVVGLVPTDPPEGLDPNGPIRAPSWWSEPMGYVHVGAAFFLLATFIVFCFFLFPLTSTPDDEPLEGRKQVQIYVYFGCGITMVVSIVLCALCMLVWKTSIFWPETIAVCAFAFAWLVKGDFDRIPKEVGEQIKRLAAGDTAPSRAPNGGSMSRE